MFTLIIIAIGIGMHSMSGNAMVSVDHVDGFTNLELCREAAKEVRVSDVATVDAYCVRKT